MKNILIIRLSSLGDILLTTPVIRSLKKLLPDCNIDYLTKIENKETLEFNPHVRKVYIFREETSLEEPVAEATEQSVESAVKEEVVEEQSPLTAKKTTTRSKKTVQ